MAASPPEFDALDLYLRDNPEVKKKWEVAGVASVFALLVGLVVLWMDKLRLNGFELGFAIAGVVCFALAAVHRWQRIPDAETGMTAEAVQRMVSAEIDDRAKKDSDAKRSIRDTLGQFMAEGSQLRMRLQTDMDQVPVQDVEGWADRTGNYLSATLGSAYSVRFMNWSEFYSTTPDKIANAGNLIMWRNVGYMLNRLEQFMQELR